MSAFVAGPVDEVFDWVTTAGRWPQYSPTTLAIESSDRDLPLRANDRFREQVRIQSWRGHFDWTVQLLDRPNRCVLTGISSGESLVSRLAGHDAVHLELTFSGDEHQTQITRELSYHVGFAEVVGDLVGFGEAVDRAADITMTTMVSMIGNPLLRGPRPDATSESLLHEADPLADEAVASLVPPSGDLSALERFIAGLYRGAPQSEDLPEPLRRFFDVTSRLPSWTCQPRLDAASDVFLDWGVLAVGAHICASLPETYVMPRVARLLNLTRQLDADPTHADRRIWFTVRMCLDVLAQHGLGPRGEGLLALQRLRLIHAVVRLFVQHRLDTPHRLSKLASAALWDTENGQPVSQLELLHTLLTFSHVVVRSLEKLGAALTPYQAESYIHLWNVAGAQLGIRPELLPRDAADAARMFETMKARYATATPEAKDLGRALVWFWTSLFPKDVRSEGRELMQFVISQLISAETAAMNGLDDLPDFSAPAAHAVKACLDASGRLCSGVFHDVPGARQATALFISLLMRARTHTFEDQSGTFDIPQELYERWRGVPATA
jgi:ER-bound oxygenase mpaB/B'/Rubber oxygenase, catalytic domain